MKFSTARRVLAVTLLGVTVYSLATISNTDNLHQSASASLEKLSYSNSGSVFVPDMRRTITIEHNELNKSSVEQLARVGAEIAGTVTNDTLIKLHEEATALALVHQTPFTTERSFALWGNPITASAAFQKITHLETESETRKQALEAIVIAWEQELTNEKARIVAEEARKAAAAEAARIAALQTVVVKKPATVQNTTPRTGNSPAVPQNTAAESAAARLQRLSASLPFSTVPVVIGDCSGTGVSGAVACYMWNDYIIITPGYLNRSDCKIRGAIAHENRHYWQYINGKVAHDGKGNVTNTADLEADAYSFGAQYGC